MRKIGKRDVAKLVIVLALIAGIGFAMGTVGRFVPTHKIVEPVYCGSCHPEQVGELAATTHLGSFAAAAQKMANLPRDEVNDLDPGDPGYHTDFDYSVDGKAGYGRPRYGNLVSDAESISMACTMCHNFWENFKWFGVINFRMREDQIDEPDTIVDIYGNEVSPYGLGSTKSFVMEVDATNNAGAVAAFNTAPIGLEPWTEGLDIWRWTGCGPDGICGNGNDETHTRLDYVWSALSAKSPGPVGFRVWKDTSHSTLLKARSTTRYVSCGTAEKGMCHFAENAVAMAAADKKLEYPDQASLTVANKRPYPGPNGVIDSNPGLDGKWGPGAGPDGIWGNADDTASDDIALGDDQWLTTLPNSFKDGSGVFYTHEMAYTTAQYAAKPVRICGACHALKLPPMKWGGEPWAGDSVRLDSTEVTYAQKGYIGSLNVPPSENPPANRIGAGGPEHKVVITDTGVWENVVKGAGNPFDSGVTEITPTYDQSGTVSWTRDATDSSGALGDDMSVTYRTPDWAHQIVPCIRCHTHAGINGESVSDETE